MIRKVKITLPAALTNLGAAVGALGLALSLHTVVEISERKDSQLLVDTEGEDAGRYSTGLRHPVVLALLRVFQKFERAPAGVNVRVSNQIPVDSGLGAEAAFLVAGVIGGFNLVGQSYTRLQVLEMAAGIAGQADGVLTTLLGGLTSGIRDGEKLSYRSLPVQSMKVVVVVPRINGYGDTTSASMPEWVTFQDAVHNLARVPLLMEGLRSGDVQLISRALDDKLHTPALASHITGYRPAVEMARRSGAAGVTISGRGPALVAFSERNHEAIGEGMIAGFASANVAARFWVLPIDTQGVVISAAQSA